MVSFYLYERNLHEQYGGLILSIVSTKQMLLKAQQGGYAVAAFNVENMEMVQAICDSAIN